MKGPYGLCMFVLLAFSLGEVTSQTTTVQPTTNQPGIIQFNMYLVNMTFNSMKALQDRSSKAYNDTRTKIQEAFTGIGGSLEEVIFLDGGGCMKAYIQWRDGDQLKIMPTMDFVKNNGIFILNQNWKVSFKGCEADQLMVFKYYVVGMPWSENLAIEASAEFKMFTNMILQTFVDLGGTLQTLKLSKNEGCIQIYLEWNTADASSILTLAEKLKANGIMYMNQTYNITSKPCAPSTVEYGQCPVNTGGSFGICVEECNATDPQMSCMEGFRCCSNGCGHACKRVGFKVQINGTMTLNTTWTDSLRDSNMSASVASSIKGLIQNKFGRDVVTDVELISISNYTYRGQKVPVVSVRVFLADDLPNESLKQSEISLPGQVVDVGTSNVSIIAAYLGKSGVSETVSICGGDKCEGVCKQPFSGVQYCSCGAGYHGSSCDSFDCRKDLSQIPNTTASFCPNSIACSRVPNSNQGYTCHCPVGYYGDVCEARLCDWINNCSGQGTCVGSLVDAKLCECNPGRGGLFCELNMPDNLTKCERESRLMTFVNENLHSDNGLQSLNKPLAEILLSIGLTEYQVPTCLKTNDSSNGEYYSSCTYDVSSGKNVSCKCLYSDGSTKNYPSFDGQNCQSNAPFVNKADLFITAEWSEDLRNTGSQLYRDVTSQLTALIQQISSYPSSVSFDGRSGCITAHLSIYIDDYNDLQDILKSIKDNGIQVNGVKAQVSDVECQLPDESTMLQFRVYVENLTLPGDYKNHQSNTYNLFLGLVTKAFANLNGSLRGLELEQKNGCAELFVQWVTPDVAGFLHLIDTVKRDGVTVLDQHYNINTKPCSPDETTLVEFRLFVSMPSSKEYSNTSSDKYIAVQNLVKKTFESLGGNLLTLILTPKLDDCVEFFIQWNTTDTRNFLTIMDNIKSKGVQWMGQVYNIKTKPCTSGGGKTCSPMCMNNGNCTYSFLKQEYLCQCPIGFSGQHCEVDICSYVKSDACNKGKCLGNLVDWKMCTDCPTGSGGLFCDGSVPDNLTQCEMHRRLTSYAVSVLNGSHSNDKLIVDMKDFLQRVTVDSFYVPMCKNGAYYAMCQYNMDNGHKEMCHCVDDMGRYKMWRFDQVAEQCREPRDSSFCGSNKIQCNPLKEKCLSTAVCMGSSCTEYSQQCVSKDMKSSCDEKPCKNDPDAKCDPCNGQGQCYNQKISKDDPRPPWLATGNQDYICHCDPGFSGDSCETNDEICQIIPKGFCELGCMGDINSGQFCKCPNNYAGLQCNKPARTPCERRKALYDDAIAILNGRATFDPYSIREIKLIVQQVLNATRTTLIPSLSCTPGGQYRKTQCSVKVSNLTENECFCVDQKGNSFLSNLVPYIGFEICTAPADFSSLSFLCGEKDPTTGKDLIQCFNGGQCVANPMKGKLCRCLSGFYGQLCENVGSAPVEPKSLCDYMAGSWNTAKKILTGQTGNWNITDLQKQVYLNLTVNFLAPKDNNSLLIKPDCYENGMFKPAACYHNITSEQRADCYCWANGGLISNAPVSGPDAFNCTVIQQQQCPNQCPDLKCQFGQRTVNSCPTCECKRPCETMTCMNNERCVEEDVKCDDQKLGDSKCARGVCRLMIKPGVCPVKDGNSLDALVRTGVGLKLRDANNTMCPTECVDDSDCSDNRKCCGVCGSKCVAPEKVDRCQDDRMLALQQRDLIRKVREEIQNSGNLSTDALRMIYRAIKYDTGLLIPSCKFGGDFYEAIQCLYSEDDSTPVSCFCVDLLGTRIDGLTANLSDPTSCNVKPYTCPALEPATNPDDDVTCKNDLDCLGGDKCCSGGVDMVCATPVDKEQLVSLVDRLMSEMCVNFTELCQGNSSCTGQWMKDGQACVCPNGRMGPFCEQTASGDSAPKTACKKKLLANSVFLKQLSEMYTAGPQSFVKLLQAMVAQKMSVDPNYDLQTDVISMIDHQCLDNGQYAPTQCVHYLSMENLSKVKMPDCFCVDVDGQEILGTRMSTLQGQPFCGGSNTCPWGNALHSVDGQLQQCGTNTSSCPYGYACKRGTYGQLNCCPTKEGLKDVCMLPADVGMTCPDGKPDVTRYFYDFMTKECKTFSFKGCGGNYNNFADSSLCSSRCKENIVMHSGSCPAKPFQVGVQGQCQDVCQSDADCDVTFKCCQSSCAKRCIPAVDETDKNRECPMGQPQGKCNTKTACTAGYYCKGNGEAGVCCIDYNTVDLCLIPPGKEDVCMSPTQRFFYNATSKMCEMFAYSGCQPGFNNFASLEDCCQACNGKGRCKSGTCPSVKLASVTSCKTECSSDGQCPGKKICCSTGCGSSCVIPDAAGNVSDCLTRQLEVKRQLNLKTSIGSSSCDVINMPKCEADGSWSRQQCQASLGICWCVTPKGNYVYNTLIRGVPSCEKLSDTVLMQADQTKMDVSMINFTVCPGGESPQCCPQALCQKPCPANPNAVCRINPCGGCKEEFYDDSGNLVNCDEGLSTCQKEVNSVVISVLENQITATMATGMSLDDIKRGASEAQTTQMRSSLPNIPFKCQRPADPGNCKGFLPQWYYDPLTSKCQMFIWGMCGGNQNRFSTPEECYQTCNSVKSPCSVVRCPGEKPCQLDYNETCYMSEEGCLVRAVCRAAKAPSSAIGPFLPECLPTGEYNYKQCQSGYCWCVNDKGVYLDGLTNMEVDKLECTSNGSVANTSLGVDKCSNNQLPNVNCIKACNNKVCPNYPNAQCTVDLCSTSCSTKFVDQNGAEVTCGDQECKVFTFNETKRQKCSSAPALCQGAKNCPESICQRALKQNCNKNPCAVCMLDTCTCQPYFVDALTRKNLTQSQCSFLSVGTCAIKTCNIMKELDSAEFNKYDLLTNTFQLPTCSANGRFEARQCVGDTCKCVDAFGEPTNSSMTISNETCQAIDEVKRVKLTLTFNADFKRFQRENKLGFFKSEVNKTLIAMGIDPKTIKEVTEPYEGSVKINITFEQEPSSANTDMTIVVLVVMQGIQTGSFTITIDNETIELNKDGTTVEAQTASQVSVEERKESEEGLSERDKIIIGCVVGIGGGLILIAVIVLCLCCRDKKEKPSYDPYERVKPVEKSFHEKGIPPMHNQAYQEDDEDDKFIKVKL
ncbi:unnamed protein product [Lymnaea stagnalis]|uniref:Uncharacterized protein n=1 Tax=Lymnaea stagnalis TaxID=6523 RepID=A0AAV2I790_LYMST